MAELIVQLRIDPETGKKNVVVKYESDADALPHEHEEDHRRLVDQLIAAGALDPSEVGEVVVERLPDEADGPPAEAEPEGASRAALEADDG